MPGNEGDFKNAIWDFSRFLLYSGMVVRMWVRGGCTIWRTVCGAFFFSSFFLGNEIDTVYLDKNKQIGNNILQAHHASAADCDVVMIESAACPSRSIPTAPISIDLPCI